MRETLKRKQINVVRSKAQPTKNLAQLVRWYLKDIVG
jgi:hypothetical protein